MGYLPQMVVSWEVFLVAIFGSFSLGAFFWALARDGVRRKENPKEPIVVRFQTAEAREAAKRAPEKYPDGPGETLGELAGRLWLNGRGRSEDETPEVPVLKESRLADPDFSREETMAFWEEMVVPHRDLFEKRGELQIMEKILLELDRHGLCSSVVAGDGRSSFKLTARRFSEVTLLDHSLRSARHMAKIHNSMYGEKILYGKHLIAALAHDIGKMKKHRGDGKYVKDDHAAASAKVLAGWTKEDLGEETAREFGAVVKAVRNHHRRTNGEGGLLASLKKADSAAREEEFSGGKKNPAAGIPDRDGAPGWLIERAGSILNESVLPVLNVPAGETEPFVLAFSTTAGVVYVCPHFLFEKVRERMEVEGIADMRFFDSSPRAEMAAKILVTNALKSFGWVAGGVGDGYYAAFWNYTYKGKKVRKGGFWIPVFAEAFDTELADLEKIKNADLRRLTSIEPCMKRGSKK